MSGVSLSDVLSMVLTAGRRLGVAEARALIRGWDHPDVRQALAETLQAADVIAAVDPVAAGVVRQAVYDVMADAPAIDGDGRDIVVPALEPGE